MLGQRFGRLSVIASAPPREGRRFWRCRCDCGTVKDVRDKSLRNGDTRSCGCLRNETTSARRRVHGMSRSREYAIWNAIKRRCYKRTSADYPAYGGRGIVVSDEWRVSFDAFYRDMGPRPEGAAIERIDNDGPYSRDNCRWATAKEQASNTRRNHRIELSGTIRTLAEWSATTGIDRRCIVKRLRRGWSPERALTTPAGAR